MVFSLLLLGATVILATILGFPVSTTHSLVGAIVGAGLLGAGSDLDLAVLATSFVAPLLVSPFVAVCRFACPTPVALTDYPMICVLGTP